MIHAAVAVALLSAYVLLTMTGHAADELLGVLAGYVGGAGTHALATSGPRQG